MHHCQPTTVSIDWIRHGHACSNGMIESKDWGPAAMQFASRRKSSSMASTVKLAGLSNLGVECVRAARNELFIPPEEGQRQGNGTPFVANYDAVACSLLPRAIETAMLLFLPPSEPSPSYSRKKLPVLYVCEGIGELPTHLMLGMDIHNQTPWKSVRQIAEFVEATGREHGLDTSGVSFQYAVRRSKKSLERRPDRPKRFFSSAFMQAMIQDPARDSSRHRHPQVRLAIVSHGKYIRKILSLRGGVTYLPTSTPNVSIHRQHLTYECADGEDGSRMSACILGKVESLWAPDANTWGPPRLERLTPKDVERCGFVHMKRFRPIYLSHDATFPVRSRAEDDHDDDDDVAATRYS